MIDIISAIVLWGSVILSVTIYCEFSLSGDSYFRKLILLEPVNFSIFDVILVIFFLPITIVTFSLLLLVEIVGILTDILGLSRLLKALKKPLFIVKE